FDMPVGWPRVSAAFHDQLLLAGPIATFAAYFYCANLSGRRRLVALPTAPRVGHLSVLRSFALVLGWVLAAYLLPFVPLVVHTAVTESHGSIDLFAALAGPVGMCLAIALGCVAGTSFPRPVAAPAAAVLVFLLFQLPNLGLPEVAGFVPTLGQRTVTYGLVEYPVFVAYRLVSMFVLSALLLGAAGLVARRARPAEWIGWRSGAALCVGILLVT